MKVAKIKSIGKSVIEKGFKNPFGMEIENTKEIREAVANHAKSIISNLHRQKKNN
jgi:hypothetical protein